MPDYGLYIQRALVKHASAATRTAKAVGEAVGPKPGALLGDAVVPKGWYSALGEHPIMGPLVEPKTLASGLVAGGFGAHQYLSGVPDTPENEKIRVRNAILGRPLWVPQTRLDILKSNLLG